MEKDSQKYDYSLKTIVFGCENVGKSMISSRFAQNNFKFDYLNTIGGDFFNKIIKVNETQIQFQIWDTPGDIIYFPRFLKFLKNAACYIFVYDVTNEASFEELSKRINYLGTEIPFLNKNTIIVGNKTDCYSRKLSYEAGLQLAQSLNFKFIEVSAKENYNINELFTILASVVLDKLQTKTLYPEYDKNGIDTSKSVN